MLKKTKRNKQHSTAEKNIKTDINNEKKLAQKKTNQRQKAPINTEMLKNANRRTQQTQKRQPPDNDKMIDKRRKPTKPRTKRANNGIKETYHRKTSRQAIKQQSKAKNRQNQYSRQKDI